MHVKEIRAYNGILYKEAVVRNRYNENEVTFVSEDLHTLTYIIASRYFTEIAEPVSLKQAGITFLHWKE